MDVSVTIRVNQHQSVPAVSDFQSRWPQTMRLSNDAATDHPPFAMHQLFTDQGRNNRTTRSCQQVANARHDGYYLQALQVRLRGRP